ncbi:hypothetical protein [Paenibacillus agricola]|uniref:Uncharacterized protein n=1 Tax=Paenibacillus agricola TaxID=2716264 RepID=A0ABX0J7J1_9BACL|nr:hypothetical protein [Paenibacillus agricola]NHN30837.1 hypothetical protein [Paenibacillus agricola]
MEPYQTLIGVVLEKVGQTYKELKFNYDGLEGVLKGHSQAEIEQTPELLTITMLKDMYGALILELEQQLPGIKD